jgi:hypothetical protein
MGHLRAILFGDMPMPRARMPHGLCATLAFVARSSPSRYWQEFFLLAAFERGDPIFAGAIAAGTGKWLPCQQNDDDVSTLELLPLEHPRRSTCAGLGPVHRRQASSRPGVRIVCAFRRLCLVFSCFRDSTAQGGHRLADS